MARVPAAPEDPRSTSPPRLVSPSDTRWTAISTQWTQPAERSNLSLPGLVRWRQSGESGRDFLGLSNSCHHPSTLLFKRANLNSGWGKGCF
ncbi:hypothetical protein DPEC_G00104720 [Dallia pectoralis]|uniref:Uncharacterized protein n=1 Tax=Dallia pectoralis TaxID=75939 RepID=A0ACC2GXG5_DALPE|nr:hypothetical protein DPEC_G00104720 [Dallia pectoralis]